MYSLSAMPPSPAVLADTLVRRAYGRALHIPEDWPRLEPWHEVAAEALIPAAQRIARNALQCEDTVTDSLGVPIHDTDGHELGRLWSCRGDNAWLSAFCSTSHDPKTALDEWLAWAYPGETPPPHRLHLVDIQVPVISNGMFGSRATMQADPRRFDSLHEAAHHAAVISLVETCLLQRRNPTGFLTDLLAQELEAVV